ncbi:MAG: hypothetical protein RLN62_00605 [Rickettsiales bacterium]
MKKKKPVKYKTLGIKAKSFVVLVLLLAGMALFLTYNKVALSFLGFDDSLKHKLEERNKESPIGQCTNQAEANVETLWFKFLSEYYSGKESSGTVRHIKLLNDKNFRVDILALEDCLENNRFDPASIYTEFEKLSEKMLQDGSKITMHGYIGQVLSKFITISKPRIIGDNNSIDIIKNLILNQKFNHAVHEIKKQQRICNCFEEKDYSQIARQAEIRVLISRINKSIRDTEK